MRVKYMKKGSHLSEEHKRKLRLAHLGKKQTEEVKIKRGLYRNGNKHPNWRGDEVKYRALHDWVVKNLGQSDICEYCKISGLTKHQIHWANISGEYKRELTDWVRLCVRCHSRYDNKLISVH